MAQLFIWALDNAREFLGRFFKISNNGFHHSVQEQLCFV